MEYRNFLCSYDLSSKLYKLGVDSNTEFYFIKKGSSKSFTIITKTHRLLIDKFVKKCNNKRSFIPAFMSSELGEILPRLINIGEPEINTDWLQLTQYFPNADCDLYAAAYVRYNDYDSPSDVYIGFGDTEVESRAMLLIDLLEKKVLTLDDLNLKKG